MKSTARTFRDMHAFDRLLHSTPARSKARFIGTGNGRDLQAPAANGACARSWGLAFAAAWLIWLGTVSDALGADPEGFSETMPSGLTLDMIVVRDGNFTMGSPDDEAGRSKREGPQKSVRIAAPFALARTEITVRQFAAFVAATGFVTEAEKQGEAQVLDTRNGRLIAKAGMNWRHDFRGREADENLPAIRVAWRDAKAFTQWLADETGQDYRLPSEAEFEYALRAGSASRYWWGDDSPDRRVENLPGDRERLRELRWPAAFRGYTDGNWGPSPVASFEPNPFGLFDMGGNVTEWTEDCYVEGLDHIPADGSPYMMPSCEKRVLRGGAWAFPPPIVRSAFRDRASEDYASSLAGFRVARGMSTTTESMAKQ